MTDKELLHAAAKAAGIDVGGWNSDREALFCRHTVTVLDVRDGWVRYSMGSVFNDNRSKMKVFLFCYGRPRSEEVRQGEQG
jgi:hypothetical protein